MTCVQTEAPVRKSFQRIPVYVTGSDVPDCPCYLVGIDAGMLRLRAERQIPESSSLVVSFDHVQLSGVVAGCLPVEDEWLISVALSSRKRRLEERIPHGEEGTIGVVASDTTSRRPCTITDASPFGLGLRLGFPVDPGARVCVETVSMMVFGEVRHCHPGPDGQFIAGLLIIDVVSDLRNQNPFSVMLNNLRWKLALRIRGKNVLAYRSDH